ncbi:MAG: SLC13 family permease [Chitinophagaceae bacterium]
MQQYIVLGITFLAIVFLLVEKFRPSYIFFSAVLILLLAGVLHTNAFLSALANESIISIFLLIFITAGIKNHFNIIGWLDRLFGKTKNPKHFMLRMTSGVTLMSAFLNNTPVVAMMMPYIYQWSGRNKVSRSKLLIPLSFAAITGGMITVIGTSTNLVLNGLIIAENGKPLGWLDYLMPGLIVSIGGILFLYFIGYKLLPNRNDPMQSVSKQSREYLLEAKITKDSPVIGKSVLHANLRNMTGIYLVEIIRKGELITPVEPNEILEEGDTLFFAGDTNNIMELMEREKEFLLPKPNKDDATGLKGHNLIETVVPFNSDLVGTTLKKVEFRENYDAAVIAIHRNGEKLRGKIGEIEMQAGDLLLLSAGKSFAKQLNSRTSLYMVSEISKPIASKPIARTIFVVILSALLIALIAGVIQLFLALLVLASSMVVLNLLKVSEMKKQLDVDLLVILVSSLALSAAIIQTGTAAMIADNFLSTFKGLGNAGIIIGLYLVTLLLTSFVTHIAAVSIVFPIAFAMGAGIPGLNMAAVFVAIAFAASASFHAPFSYQTNLMIYGPGGYKFKDFLKVGLPFSLIYSVLVIAFILVYYKI